MTLPDQDPTVLAGVVGMIAKLKEEAGLVDWRHVLTTSFIAVLGASVTFYVSVEKQLVELRSMITSRVESRNAQLAALADADHQLKNYVQEREAATRSELVALRHEIMTCRENMASLTAKVSR